MKRFVIQIVINLKIRIDLNVDFHMFTVLKLNVDVAYIIYALFF